MNKPKLEALNQKLLLVTQNHPVYEGRRVIVGVGNIPAPLVLVGEAPGSQEEQQGKPFVGQAGQNLTRFLEGAGLSREKLYITNLVKVRTVKTSPKTQKLINRTPDKDDVAFFTPFLLEELQLIQPQTVVTLGNVPLRGVMGDNKLTIGDVHGQTLAHPLGFEVFPLYHPASVIYNRQLAATYEQDLQLLCTKIGNI